MFSLIPDIVSMPRTILVSSKEEIACAVFGPHILKYPGGVEGWLERSGLRFSYQKFWNKRPRQSNISIFVSRSCCSEESEEESGSWFSLPIDSATELEAVTQAAREHSSLFWEIDPRIGWRNLGPIECPIFDSPHCANKRSADENNPSEYWGGGLVGWID